MKTTNFYLSRRCCWPIRRRRLLDDPYTLIDFDERLRVLRRHFELMVEVFGEELGCRMFRKVAPWYSRRFGPSSRFNKRIVHISTRGDFEQVLSDYLAWRRRFLDAEGRLQSRYQPPPMVPSFMHEESDAPLPSAIPVPKGPVEVW